MLHRLSRRVAGEPEAVTTLTALASSQALCPGVCAPCMAPVAGAAGGGALLRFVRRERR